jgi:hypothetical protein
VLKSVLVVERNINTRGVTIRSIEELLRLIRRPSPPALNTINNSTNLEPEKQQGIKL